MDNTEDPVQTQDIYEEKSMLIVEQLIEQGIIEMESDTPVLYHVPTGAKFDSAVNIAHFHRGWEAGKQEK
jgi:hypothetical protein